VTLKDFLLAILTGSFGIGPVIFVAFERMAWFSQVSDEYKRWVVAGASGVLGVAAWGLALWLGYVEQPSTYSPEYVANGIWTYGILVGYSAFTAATLLHGHLAMRKASFIFTPDKH
jgi:hypothetical protein